MLGRLARQARRGGSRDVGCVEETQVRPRRRIGPELQSRQTRSFDHARQELCDLWRYEPAGGDRRQLQEQSEWARWIVLCGRRCHAREKYNRPDQGGYRATDRGENALAAQVHALGSDRSKLASDLDAATAHSRKLEATNREIAQRLDVAIDSIRSVIEAQQ